MIPPYENNNKSDITRRKRTEPLRTINTRVRTIPVQQSTVVSKPRQSLLPPKKSIVKGSLIYIFHNVFLSS